MDKLVSVKTDIINKEEAEKTGVFWREFFPEKPAVRETRGRAWLLTNLRENRGNFNPAVLAESLMAGFAKNYFQNQTGSVYQTLKQTLEILSSELADFFEENSSASIAAIVLWGNILYPCLVEPAKIIILRSGKPRSVFPAEREKSRKPKIASGYIEDDDVVIVSGTDLPTEKMAAAAGLSSPDKEAASFPPGLLVLRFSLAPVPSTEEESIRIARISEKAKKEAFSGFFRNFSSACQQAGLVWQKIRLNPFLSKLSLPKSFFSPLLVVKRSEEEKKKRQAMSLAIFLFIVFAVSLFLGVNKRRMGREWTNTEGIAREARENFAQGRELLEINPAMARKYLFRAQEKIAKAKQTEKENREIKDLSASIDALLEQALKIVRVGQMTEFYNLSLLKKQTSAVSLTLFDDILYFLSPGGEIFSVSARTKAAKILAGKQEETGSLTAIPSGVYFLRGKSLMTIKSPTEKMQISVPDNPIWGEIAAGAGFSNNLYLLDRQKNQIWKYVFGPPLSIRPYIAETEAVNFEKAVDIAIDGFIWVLFSDGRVEKFAGRVKDVFALSGLDQPLKNPRTIYNDENTAYLYILDRDNGRVVLFDKEGNYFSQYQAPGLEKATDLAVAEKEKKMYVLDREKVYLVDLKY